MLDNLKLNLQLFGEGGDGGDGGSASATGESMGNNSGEDTILASIPEKAKKHYRKAMEKNPAPSVNTQSTTEAVTTAKMSYEDMIKSEDYKDAHKAYMDKTIGDRLKKYKGLEESYGKAKNALDVVAHKYGVNPDDENFLETLSAKIMNVNCGCKNNKYSVS